MGGSSCGTQGGQTLLPREPMNEGETIDVTLNSLMRFSVRRNTDFAA